MEDLTAVAWYLGQQQNQPFFVGPLYLRLQELDEVLEAFPVRDHEGCLLSDAPVDRVCKQLDENRLAGRVHTL